MAKRLAEAERQLIRVATEGQRSPVAAEANEALGSLAAQRRDWVAAKRRYQAALQSRPDFGRALVGLGTVEALSGDVSAARRTLAKAAASTDATIRGEAADLLRTLESAGR
jgi:Flp pilus assembly protein TadD